MKEGKWYNRQLKGLYHILNDASEKDIMVSREYVKEKLMRVIKEIGIGFHPVIEQALDEEVKRNESCKRCGKMIFQCRCYRKDKVVKYSICKECEKNE